VTGDFGAQRARGCEWGSSGLPGRNEFDEALLKLSRNSDRFRQRGCADAGWRRTTSAI